MSKKKTQKNNKPTVILCAAGRGKRLLPYTKSLPKALVKVRGKSILEYILDAIYMAGIRKVIIVTGFMSGKIEKKIGRVYKGINILYVHNPDYMRSDNLYSLFLARDHIIGDIIFMNADQIVHKDIMKQIVATDRKNAIAVDFKSSIDNDSMKVRKDKKGRLLLIGKRIMGKADGQALGIYRLSGREGGRYFQIAEKYFRRGPRRGGFVVPLRVMTKKALIWLLSSKDARWIEIDTPEDLEKAKRHIKEIIGS